MTAPDLLTFYRFAHTVYAVSSLQRQLFQKATEAVIRLEVHPLFSPQLNAIVAYPFKGVNGASRTPVETTSMNEESYDEKNIQETEHWRKTFCAAWNEP